MIESIQIYLRLRFLLLKPVREIAMIGKLDEALGFQQTALSLRAQRQQILASNIANADTPNFKARDMDFAKALQGALAKTDGSGTGLAKTAAGHIDGNQSATLLGGAPLLYRSVQQGSVDGNTVDMDVERNQFADNALRYEAGVTIIGAQIKMMLAAVQG
jgi:flagellar basal-body rod protein FlgB